MKIRDLVIWAAAITAFVVIFVPAIASTQGQKEMSEQDKKMMEQMMKYGTPGKEHELLKKYVGEWDVDIATYQDPAKPEMSKGTMKNMLILDGRYLKCDFEGMMGGMAAKGLEIIGYDLFKKEYTTFWIDSWSTAFTLTHGTLDTAGKVLTETGEFPDAMTDGKTLQKVKNVTTFMDDGSYKFEMYMVMPDGKEMKGMELVCKRK
jgi:hypothetical protein